MAEWYGSREQLMSLHGLDTASMLGYGMGAASAYPPIQPEAFSAHAAAAAAYNFQRQQQSVSSGFSHSFGPEQQWRHNADGSIMELRKEKSRDAARSRRGKENYEFYELAKMLPLPGAITSQLDKASIIRLTISYLKLRDFTLHGDPPWHREGNGGKGHKEMRYKGTPGYNQYLKGSGMRHSRNPSTLSLELFEQHQGTHILQSLDGFAFNLGSDGRFLYIAETVSIYLGLSQVEMTGSSVFDYIHVDDHQELANQLCLTLATGQSLPSPSSVTSEDAAQGQQGTMNPDVSYPVTSCMNVGPSSKFKGYDRAFCIRMKSTLTKRGCHFKCSGYRVLLILGHMRPQYVFTHNRKSNPILLGFVALAIALPPPSVHEVRLEPDMFVTKLNFDFTIAHCEPRVSDLLDYTPDEITGRSLYSLCHGQDVEKMRKAHSDLMLKGQVSSPYFRLLNKRGGFTWLQICATVICNSKSGEDQNIICINYVLSKCEYDSSIFDDSQLDPTLANLKPDQGEFVSNHSPENSGEMSIIRGAETGSPPPQPPIGGATGSPLSGASESSTLTPIRGSPEHPPSEGAQIKTEVPGLLTPLGSAEMGEEQRVHTEGGKTSPSAVAGGRLSIPPTSTPSRTPILPLTAHLSPTNHPKGCEEGSVRDLEAAMTRHLPEDATDALLRGGHTAGHRSTIQWVGGSPGVPQGTNSSGSGTQQGSLPASTLLRQLYANRESVIRTSVQRSYYPDVQSTLPTPPGGGGENYQDGMFSKGHEFSFNGGVGVNGSIPVPGGGGAYTDYHSAMTPPSSVSPREKLASECSEMRQAATYLSEVSSGGIPAQPVPLKPHVYYGPASVSLEAPSYSSPLTDQSSSLYPHSGFHLYNSQGKSPNAYDALRTSSGWYAPSS